MKDILKEISESIDNLGIFNIWLGFTIIEIFIYYYVDMDLALLVAVLMLPMFFHDILGCYFKHGKNKR